MRMVVPERGVHGEMVRQELEARIGHGAHSIGICKALGLLLSTGEGVARNEGGVNKKKEGKIKFYFKKPSRHVFVICAIFLYVHYIFIGLYLKQHVTGT